VAILQADLRFAKRKEHRMRLRLCVERQKLAIQKLARTTTPVSDRAFSENFAGVVTSLKHLCQYGEENSTANPQQNAMAIACDMLQNVSRTMLGKSRKGMRYSPRTSAFLATLRSAYGLSTFSFATANLGSFGDERTARRWTPRPEEPFMLQIRRADFMYIRNVYTAAMERHAITTKCAVEVAEDETAIQMRVGYDSQSDNVVGYCGHLCNEKCATIVDCRRRQCNDPHSCRLAGYMMKAGQGAAGYANLVEEHGQAKVGREGRLLVLNPSDSRLPQVPIAWLPTCKTVSCVDYVEPQWQQLEQLYMEIIEPILGPLVSHSSDGDSTRRAAFLRASLSSIGARLVLNVEGFVYSGSITVDNNNTKRKHLKLNSDYLHCIKKFVNVTDTGRTLVMGDYIVTLSLVSSIMEHCNRADHGLHTTDHKRKGYDQMDVPSCIRLLSLRVHVCLEDCITGFAGSARVPLLPCVPQTQLIGIQTYLDTLRRFAEMFMSRKLKHAERVRSAGYVVTFFRLWRLWLLRCTTHTLEAAYVTKEGRVDCALACHFVVLWLMVCRDDFPFHEPNLYRTGTDVCEKFFSHIGGFIANRRVYTFLEALQTLRTFITSELELAYAGGIERATKRKRRIPTWDELPDNHV
jgi:hypothetical protein